MNFLLNTSAIKYEFEFINQYQSVIQRDLQLVSLINDFCSHVIICVKSSLKLIKIAVKLSELFLLIAYFITSSTHLLLIL